MPLLEVSELRAGYGPIEILHGVSLTVDANDYVAVLGANGAGKTTLLRAISGVVDIRGGRIAFADEELTHRPAHRIPSLGIAHVPEGRQVFPRLSVLDNLIAGAWLRRDVAERRETLEKLFALFPILKARSSQPAGTLSGGEQQMLAIARGLMLRPKMMMLDEPSQGLAPKVVAELYAQLAAVHSTGTAILLVEQSTTAALKHAHRAYVMEHGRIVMSGASEDLRDSDEIRKAYLGM